MKKFIIVALALTTICTSSFATMPGSVNKQILNTFNKIYSTAADVKWESAGDCVKAAFKVDGQRMFAYFHEDGELVAVTRNLTTTQLPISLASDLKAKCTNQWLTELFEISTDDETAYYATLYSADQITVLKAGLNGKWTVSKKTRRSAE